MDEGAARWLVRLVVVLAAVPDLTRGDVAVMKDVTLGFGQALDKCRKETGLSEEVMEEFFHFWHEDFKFEHRELGCALLCMSQHFDLLTDSHRMHHQKTEDFIRSFPNGEILSQKMIKIIHTCEQKWEHLEDHCWRILRVAECFKTSCVEANLAPTVEMIIAEFIMEATS